MYTTHQYYVLAEQMGSITGFIEWKQLGSPAAYQFLDYFKRTYLLGQNEFKKTLFLSPVYGT